ncbi:MAG: hypothetical protein A2W22_06470 [Candidatus Levybacteria bacterium RBG_16_35_11]|nr:MAG: hypothetical protein A2W22_06470 [Candidatus Levybacteria bacterium RBG_16_35_11]
MKKKLSGFFYPHDSNNYRARLLHLDSLLVIILALIISSFLLTGIKTAFPSVLGISTGMSIDQLLALTNQKRIENGLTPLALNSQLSVAAENKASDMFSKNYWAHNSPDGKTPWDFISSAGYSYAYAGENLARGFNNSDQVINAWMASPEHRQNMLSSNYKNIGFAIRPGNLTGEDTVLVVEMFGTGIAIAQNAPEIASNNTIEENYAQQIQEEVQKTEEVPKPQEIQNPTLAQNSNQEQNIAGLQTKPLLNSKALSKNIVLIVIYILIFTLLVDVIIIEKRKVIRFVGHNLDHVLFLIFILSLVFLFTKGFIL